MNLFQKVKMEYSKVEWPSRTEVIHSTLWVVTNILVTEEELTEIVRGKPKKIYRKLFPAYVMLEMEATREENEQGISYKVDPRVWYEVRNTNGVTGFVGVGSDPIPMEEEEVKNIFKIYKYI